jgi:hypothetical protein
MNIDHLEKNGLNYFKKTLFHEYGHALKEIFLFSGKKHHYQGYIQNSKKHIKLQSSASNNLFQAPNGYKHYFSFDEILQWKKDTRRLVSDLYDASKKKKYDSILDILKRIEYKSSTTEKMASLIRKANQDFLENKTIDRVQYKLRNNDFNGEEIIHAYYYLNDGTSVSHYINAPKGILQKETNESKKILDDILLKKIKAEIGQYYLDISYVNKMTALSKIMQKYDLTTLKNISNHNLVIQMFKTGFTTRKGYSTGEAYSQLIKILREDSTNNDYFFYKENSLLENSISAIHAGIFEDTTIVTKRLKKIKLKKYKVESTTKGDIYLYLKEDGSFYRISKNIKRRFLI